MTQYVGVIRKDLTAIMTPTGPQMQQNIDAKRIPDMKPEHFGQIGVTRQQRYQEKNPQPVETGVLLYDAENNPTSQVPDAMAMRQAYEGAAKRGVIGQQIGQGIGGAIGVLGGLVSLANAGAAGQDALTGGVGAAQTGQYLMQQTQPRIGNFMGKIGAATASPVKVERQKTFDEAPMVASPTNTPAPTPTPTPAPVAVEQPRNLPSDPRQILGVPGKADVGRIQDEAMGMLGNPYYREGKYSAVNTTDEQGRNIKLPGAGPAINQFNPMLMHQPPGTASSPMTPMRTFQISGGPHGGPQHPPALTPQPAEPTVAPPTTPSASDVGQTLLTEGFGVAPPNPSEPTEAEETAKTNEMSAKDVGNALKQKMLKAEILGRQAAYDDFVKMFVEVKS